ncbi:MAG: hypothetical protein WBO24_00400 [Nitrospirales bacterium]
MKNQILIFGVLAAFGCSKAPVPQKVEAMTNKAVPGNDPEYMTSVFGAFSEVKTHDVRQLVLPTMTTRTTDRIA